QSYTNTNFINDLCGDDSVMMLATAGGFVVALIGEDPPQVIRTVVNTDGLQVNKCLCVVRDSAGNAWIGTDGGGLAVVSRDSGRAVRYRSNDVPARITCLN
ncbi:MAG: two-component regulator propeller domain-containing protein, partial [candidate division WOR-3 bacterium]